MTNRFTAVIFETDTTAPVLAPAALTVQICGWRRRTYHENQIAAACDELAGGSQALIAAIEDHDSHIAIAQKLMPVLNCAGMYDVPTAIISDHPQAEQHINPDKGDIILPHEGFGVIHQPLSDWLAGILVAHET